jgi:hypothetical protein
MRTLKPFLMSLIFAASIVGVSVAGLLPSPALAGNLEPTSGPVVNLRDKSSSVKVDVKVERPYNFSSATRVIFAALSGTSGSGVTITGASSAYAGPYYFYVNVTSPSSLAVEVNASATALTTTTTGEVGTQYTTLKIGPLKKNDQVHLRGLTDTAGGNYKILWQE